MSRRFSDLSLGTLELFARAAELQSFTAAAQASGLTPAAVSRTMARLEQRVGVRLFARSTRSVRLTEEGRRLQTHCRQALAQLDEAEAALCGAVSMPRGLVRFSMPTTYGHFRILPLLAEFRALHPAVDLELHLANRNVDLVAEGFDLAVRVRHPADSSLIARRLEDAALTLVAAPAYVQRRGLPRTLDALSQHDCIVFTMPSTGQPNPWLLRVDGQEREFRPRAALRCSEDALGPMSLARHGAGIAQVFRFVVEDDLARGHLVEVLPQHQGASRGVSLLYPAHRHQAPRVRVLVDFLMQRLAGAPRARRPGPGPAG